MKLKKAAIFCSQGLGDGLLFLVIAQNLKIEGYEVTLFHNSLFEMKKWFPNILFSSYPSKIVIGEFLSKFDKIIINADNTEINKSICFFAKNNLPDLSYLLFPTTCKGKNLPGDFLFNWKKTMVENLTDFCSNKLHCKNISRSNGVVPDKNLSYRKNLMRIIIHPTRKSSMLKWPKEKFLCLANKLKINGYEVVFILSEKEMEEWGWIKNYGFSVPYFSSLIELSSYIYESGYMIGSDSGIGHLSSCLKIPTLTIFSSRRKAYFWRPDWYLGERVFPAKWIINCKGLRLREKFWDKNISVKKVFLAFQQLKRKVNLL
jgi:hypothetical protein